MMSEESARNFFQILGREKKAGEIASMMQADGVTAEVARERMSDDAWWLTYAKSAGYNRKTAPSPECRDLVIRILAPQFPYKINDREVTREEYWEHSAAIKREELALERIASVKRLFDAAAERGEAFEIPPAVTEGLLELVGRKRALELIDKFIGNTGS